MLAKRSRKKSIKRKNISLICICFAIVVGIVGGLSLNMAQSDTSRRNPTFLENSGSMSKTSEASVTVYRDNDDDHRPGPTKPGTGNPGTDTGGNGNLGGNGSDTGSGPHGGLETIDHKTGSSNGDAPSVIVDDYGRSTFPQTGEAKDHLPMIGFAILGSMILVFCYKNRIKVY